MSCHALTGDIHQAIVDLIDRGQPFALATILSDTGSTPRKAGTKALIDASGTIWGTIGGGQVEAEAQRLAIEAIKTGQPIVFEFALAGQSAMADQPICGGKMRVLVDPTVAKNLAAYAQAADAARRRYGGFLVTRLVHEPTLRIAVQWLTEQPEPTGDMLAEPITPPPLLVIAGGGHVGQAVAFQASLVGFAILVVDDRQEFVDPALYPPGAQMRHGDIARTLAELTYDDSYVVIVTRGHSHDKQALAACIGKPAAYIGMIGSRRKVAMIFQDLTDSGIATPGQLSRIYAPIGLNIAAQTVPEIATSIVAQLICVRRKGTSPHL